MNLIIDVLRHALPLLNLYQSRGGLVAYLPLTAFDLALSLMLIVGTTRDKSDPTTVDPRATGLVPRLASVVLIAALFAAAAAIITIPIVMPSLIMGLNDGVNWWEVVTRTGVWSSVAGMSLLAGMRAQDFFESTTTVGTRGAAPQSMPVVGDLEKDREQSLGANAAQVTLIAAFVGLSFLLVNFGGWGIYLFPVMFAALQILFDTRPDLVRRAFPQLWTSPKVKSRARKKR